MNELPLEAKIALRFKLPSNVSLSTPEGFIQLFQAVLSEGFHVDHYKKNKSEYGTIITKNSNNVYVTACHGKTIQESLMAAIDKEIIQKNQ